MSELNRKYLKRPDLFLQKLREGYAWTDDHMVWVAGIFVVVFIGVSAWTLVLHWVNLKEEKQLLSYYKATLALEKKKSELLAQKEKPKDLLQTLDVEVKELEKVPGQSLTGKAAFLSYLALGDLNNETKKYPEAILQYEKALKISPNRFYKILVIYNLGYLSEQSGKYDTAIEWFQKITELKMQRVGLWAVGYRPNPFWISSAYFGMGRCYEKLKKKEEAKDAYLRVSDEFPNSQYADRGRAYAQMMN